MKSEIAVKDIMYNIIKASSLADAVTGGIYKDQRPLNSTKEDVVISVLASSTSQVQTFILNVNVYVKDVKRGDEYIENTKRLRTLSDLCFPCLTTGCADGYCYQLDSQNVIKCSDIAFHCINNRITFKIHS